MLNDIYSFASTIQDLPHHTSSTKSISQKRTRPSTPFKPQSNLSKFISLFLISTNLVLFQSESTLALRAHTKSYTIKSTSHFVEYEENLTNEKRFVKVNDEEDRIRNGNHDLHIRGRRIKAEKPHWGKPLENVVRNEGIIFSDHLIVKNKLKMEEKRTEKEENFPTASAIQSTSTSSPSASTTSTHLQSSSSMRHNLEDKSYISSISPDFPIASALSSPDFPIVSAFKPTSSSSSTPTPTMVNRDYTPLAVSTTKRTSKRPSPTEVVNKSPDDLLEEILSHLELGADGGNMKLSWH